MKLHLVSCLLMFLLGINYLAGAQTNPPEGLAAGGLLPAKPNRALLDKQARENHRSYQKGHRRAQRWVKKNNLPARRVEANGRITEIQRLNERGKPVYYTTFGVGSEDLIVPFAAEAAVTTSTQLLWQGGSLSLGLDGSSTAATGRIGIWDGSGVLATHQELTGRVSQQDRPATTGDQDHATHVAGIMVGSGLNPRARGMAFKAALKAWDWNNDLAEVGTAAAAGLLVSNHSYGLGYVGWVYNADRTGTIKWEWHGDTGIDTYEDYRFGYYDEEARQIDRLALHAPAYLMVVAAGNNRTSSGPVRGSRYYLGATNQTSTALRRGQDDYDLLSGNGVAKNNLTIGAVAPLAGGYQSAAEVQQPDFSAWGPTDDGRIKPDLVGDGVNVFSSVATSTSAYAAYNGTSMAAPNITGSLLLLQEYFARLNNNTLMRAATLKGLVIHTADEVGAAAGPDYQSGWGLLNTAKAAAVITNAGKTHLISERNLSPDETHTLEVVASGSGPLVATLSWTDPEATPLALDSAAVNNRSPRLVNDLDIRLTAGADNWLPWKLDPAQPALPAATGDNTVDNVEQIRVANPVAGKTYQVTIRHKGSLTNNGQAYSLLMSGVGGQAYCASGALSNPGGGIAQVSFGLLQRSSPMAGALYTDLTGLSAELVIGAKEPVPLQVTLGAGGSAAGKVVQVYIDWNQDFDFTDTGERVAASGLLRPGETFQAPVMVPAGLKVNAFTRMRVVCGETGDSTAVSPCGTYPRGETQDYSLKLVGPALDAGATALLLPDSTGCAGPQALQVRIRNYGSLPAGNIPVYAVVKQGDQVIATLNGVYTGTINAGREADWTLPGTFVASAGASYSLSFTTSLAGDAVAANDSFTTTRTMGAPATPPLAMAVGCGSDTISLSASGNGTAYWYDAPAGGHLVAAGNKASTTTVPAGNTYYAAFNDFSGSLAPATKSAFGGGGYGGGYQPMPLITTAVPLVLDSARLYIGYPGKLTFTVETATDSVVATSTIDVKATRTTALAADAADDPQDPGAMYALNLAIPKAGSYHIRLTYADGATIFRSNTSVSGYPFAIPQVISLTGAVYNGSALTSAYYYLYNLKVKALNCPSERVAVPLQQNGLEAPVILVNGSTALCPGESVTLSVPEQQGMTYQWQQDGNNISGATGPAYTTTAAGKYALLVSNNSCPAVAAAVPVTLVSRDKPQISLLKFTLTSNSSTGNQWYRDGVAIKDAADTTLLARESGNYAVAVTFNGCVFFSDPIYVEVPLVPGLSLYPNPATGNLVTIRYTSPANQEEIQAQLYDATGKVLAAISLVPEAKGRYAAGLNLASFANGIYVVRVQEGGKIYYERFVKVD